MRKKLIIALIAIAVVSAAIYVYEVHINYRFTEISKNKVYSSSVIPPEKVGDFAKEHGIKTIIDLRTGSVQDRLNPAKYSDIAAEADALAKVEGVQHISIPSKQIPTDETVDQFVEIMKDSSLYPVLIHCYHGTGRAVLFSALYRIEFENYSNEEARQNTRFPLIFSNFAKNSKKGTYLRSYKKRLTSADSIQ